MLPQQNGGIPPDEAITRWMAFIQANYPQLLQFGAAPPTLAGAGTIAPPPAPTTMQQSGTLPPPPGAFQQAGPGTQTQQMAAMPPMDGTQSRMANMPQIAAAPPPIKTVVQAATARTQSRRKQQAI